MRALTVRLPGFSLHSDHGSFLIDAVLGELLLSTRAVLNHHPRNLPLTASAITPADMRSSYSISPSRSVRPESEKEGYL